MVVNLPAQARLGETRVANLSVTDISSTGMQIQSPDFDTLKNGFNTAHNEAFFELHIDARMAWLQNDGGHSFLTGWEFVFTSPATKTTQVLEREEKNKRRHDRLTLELTIQGHVGGQAVEDLQLVDISPSGMQLRCGDFETIKAGLDPRSNRANFTLLFEARLAWVHTAEDGDFMTGWEFGDTRKGERIG
jgi:hypothetical protein